jgi:hypothetical protein
MGTENSIKELSIDSGEWSKQENTLNGQNKKILVGRKLGSAKLAYLRFN